MSLSELPERASLEYLKKLAKDRLQELRRSDPKAKLAAAQLAVAREHGFASWRALKAEVERRQATSTTLFFEASTNGDVATLRKLLAAEPNLVRVSDHRAYAGTTGLHEAATAGQLEAVKLLLAHGADPNAREDGDNVYPLHWAAAGGHADIVRALLDAGGDVHGFGDLHELDAIGWATYFYPHDRDLGENAEVISLLVERGARHHIFSAIMLGDFDLIQGVVSNDPNVLKRRMSRFEEGQTPLHFAMSRNRDDILSLLIDLGADLEAENLNGRTALQLAMLQGNRDAMNRLHAAGAKVPKRSNTSSDFQANMAKLANSVHMCEPMIGVSDIGKSLDWYKSIGCQELARHEVDGEVNFGALAFGKARFMLALDGELREREVSFWFYTNQIDKIYEVLKARQLEAAQSELMGEPCDHHGIKFVQDIYDPFYGGREFSIQDPNGYILNFHQRPT